MLVAVMVPSSGMLVDFVDQQHRRRGLRQRFQQRALQQVFFGKQLVIGQRGGGADGLGALDGEELALKIPLVERVVGVEPFVALQADQAGVFGARQGLGDFGFADAGIAFH
jgi:hypothetical protein